MDNSLNTFTSEAGMIDVAEENMRHFWAQKLGVSTEKLKSAVRATHSLEFEQLRTYLKNKKREQLKNKTYAKN